MYDPILTPYTAPKLDAETRRQLIVCTAASMVAAALLIAIWAIWQGGVPQFSQVGYL